MRILALIPARGGSKRLPGKNIRILGDKPLINWSIEVARSTPEICEVLVSTNDPEIALIAKAAGASVPWLRPEILSTDVATSVDVTLHALDWFERENGPVEGLLLLQPTSPFRTRESIQQGIKLFEKHNKQPVVGVSPVQDHPMWSLKKQGEYVVPFLEQNGFGSRSQDLLPIFIANGYFYLITPSTLREGHSFLGARSVPLIIESQLEAIDIDTDWDFKFAETFAKTVVPKRDESSST